MSLYCCCRQVDQYAKTLIEHNVSGRVLLNCNLDELKQLGGMNFGDWEIFRIAVLALREREMTAPDPRPPAGTNNANQAGLLDVGHDTERLSRSSSVRSTAAAGYS